MQEMKAPPKRLQSAIITRLKIQSNMSISEHRIPQDGRIQSKVGAKLIDLRVSCLPTNHGESIVMRILDKEGLNWDCGTGFFHGRPATVRTDHQPADGILLVTGPTGSGKPRRCIPVCTSSTGRTAKSSRWRTRWNISWPASTRCRSTNPSG